MRQFHSWQIKWLTRLLHIAHARAGLASVGKALCLLSFSGGVVGTLYLFSQAQTFGCVLALAATVGMYLLTALLYRRVGRARATYASLVKKSDRAIRKQSRCAKMLHWIDTQNVDHWPTLVAAQYTLTPDTRTSSAHDVQPRRKAR